MRSAIPYDRFARQTGASLVEASIVVLLMALVAGFTLLDITGITPGMAANTGLAQTVAQLRAARETAVAQRRRVEVKFLENRQIQLTRLEQPSGQTILSTLELENRLEFHLFDGVPDTPDAFGNGAAVDFAGAASLVFLSDGTLVDGQGNPVNGSVFLGVPGHCETARAVTVLGATGRIRGYRWTGSSWIQ